MVYQNDVIAILLTIGWVLAFLITSEILAKTEKISKENARKMIHIAVGNVIFFVPFYTSRWIAALIPLSFVLGNYLLSPNSPIEKMKLQTFEAGHSWGTIYYPLSLTLVVVVFFNDPQLIISAFFPLVYGDGFAAVIGPKSKSRTFHVRGNEKTVAGTRAFIITSLTSIIVGNLILLGYVSKSIDVMTIISLAIIMSTIGVIIELGSPKGMDNLFIPLILTGLLLFIQDRDMIGY